MNLLWSEAALFVIAFVLTVAGTYAFRSYAIARGIVANPNFRSLHERPMPRAGGIVFSSVFVGAVLVIWALGAVDTVTMRAIVVGGAVAALAGFIDDLGQIGPKVKFTIQCVLAVGILWNFGGYPIADLPYTPALVDLALSWLVLVWMMNGYNFMDGIDGMAASGAVFFAGAVAVLLSLGDAGQGVVLVAALLAVCSAGFLLFNWPPASIFMGDAGSLCLGYCFGALMVGTVTGGVMSIWTWVTLFGYFGGDTTTTTVLRIFLTRRWYAEHRSHAYQNLARVWNSHLRVVAGVAVYHVVWLLPLAWWSVVSPATAPIAAMLALAPVVGWTLRHGPRFSAS